MDKWLAGPRNAVGNVSGYRCVSDCRFRGREFDTFVEIDHEIISTVILLPATDACLTADPGVASSITVRSYTFVEIDHEMISTVILLPSADSFKKGCCQLQAKVCARITGKPLVQACPGKSVVR